MWLRAQAQEPISTPPPSSSHFSLPTTRLGQCPIKATNTPSCIHRHKRIHTTIGRHPIKAAAAAAAAAVTARAALVSARRAEKVQAKRALAERAKRQAVRAMHFLQHQHLAKGWAQWRNFVEETYHVHALMVKIRFHPPPTP